MNAPSVTMASIHNKIKASTYTLMPDGRTTICQLTLENGHTIIGKSACVCIENYNQALGEKYAFEDAVNGVWPLEGYLLQEQLYREASNARGDTNTFAQDQATASRELLLELFDVLQISLGHNDPVGHLKHRLKLVNEPMKAGVSYEGQSFLDHVARVCHEVNRAYCEALGDISQVPWELAPEWQRESARMGVDLHLMGEFGPEASHISWMTQKLDEGWAYGPEKNAALKLHPCICPFDMLLVAQQAKDYIFRAVVHALK